MFSQENIKDVKEKKVDVKEITNEKSNKVIDVQKNVKEAKQTVKNVHKNVEDTLNNATEIVSFTKIFTIAVVLILTLGFIKLLNWFFKNLVKNFNRHRLKILRIQKTLYFFL